MSDSSSQRSGDVPDSGFAPEDYTDGRKLGDWRSRYDQEALGSIRWEAAYLTVILVIAVVMMFMIWLGTPQRLLKLTDENAFVFARYGLAGLAGMLGGILFAMKWLYHSVAKQIWNLLSIS